MTFARSITLPPPTATITSGSAAAPSDTAASTAELGTSTAASEKTVTSRPASDSTTVAKPGRAGDHRVRDHEHAAAVVRGDAAGGGGHPGAEQHLRGRA